MATRRQRQVAELLHQELSLLIQQRARDPRMGFVTVTDVEISADLKIAHVYVSVLGSEEDAEQSLDSLNHAAGFFRRELGASVSLRHLPELDFRLDSSLEQGMHIDQLLDSLQEESPPRGGDDE
jgi:ribosome-binding factor A